MTQEEFKKIEIDDYVYIIGDWEHAHLELRKVIKKYKNGNMQLSDDIYLSLRNYKDCFLTEQEAFNYGMKEIELEYLELRKQIESQRDYRITTLNSYYPVLAEEYEKQIAKKAYEEMHQQIEKSERCFILEEELDKPKHHDQINRCIK